MAKDKARCFGQDLMRGEHIVGGGKMTEPSAMPAGLTLGELPNYDGAERTITGTSIFDPVLCEIAYRWFCAPGGQVLDPFSGGSVRGIVASMLGRRYLGVDLRPEQIAANVVQGHRICAAQEFKPRWVIGDSRQMIPTLDVEADLIFRCPPYGDLEVYSDLPEDISAMDHAAFLEAYRDIIAAAVGKLKDNRFAVFVVGDFRDKDGFYRNFVGSTVEAFERAGARYYNEAILVTAAGSLPIRAGKQFATTRKLGKTHQNVLVFCKGDPRKATEWVGEVEFGEIGAEEDAGAESAPAPTGQPGVEML